MELLFKHPDECKAIFSTSVLGKLIVPHSHILIRSIFLKLKGEKEFLESGVHSIDFEFELPRG